MSTATKLSIIDNVAGVDTSAERELFHQLYQECTHKRTTNWTSMLSKYNDAALASYRKGVCDIRWTIIPLLQKFEWDCVNVSSIAKSKERVALLQGIAATGTSSALPGPSVAVTQQAVSGPAPPLFGPAPPTNDGNVLSESQTAASILQRLPAGLTSQEREYLLGDRPQNPPWGDAPKTRPTAAGRGRGQRACQDCTVYASRFIPFGSRHKGRDKSGCN